MSLCLCVSVGVYTGGGAQLTNCAGIQHTRSCGRFERAVHGDTKVVASGSRYAHATGAVGAGEFGRRGGAGGALRSVETNE